MKYFIGLDLGTTAIKVGIFDQTGRKISVSTQEYSLITPSALIVEQDINVYWDSFRKGLTEVLAQSGVNGQDDMALSISAQSETLLFVDEAGEPLRNAIVWMDNRAQVEALELGRRFSNKEVQAVSGQPEMLATWPAPKVLWVKNNEPHVFSKIGKILLLEDYFIYRFTGTYCGEGSLWSSTLMWDIVKQRYWSEMLEALGVTEAQLPKIVESTTPVGKMLPEVTRELGLGGDVQVVMGGLDQACGAIGVGNVREGIFSESTGAALAACAMLDHPVFDPKGQMPLFYSCIPGKYIICAFSSGGIAHKWLRDVLCAEEKDISPRMGWSAYRLMDQEAAAVPAGSDGLVVLPHFMGSGAPDVDQYAKCMIYGLGLSHTKAHLIRAFMEGIAVVLARMVEGLEAMEVPVREIRSLSGGAKSALWCQIKANITGRDVWVMKNAEDAACFGAAILAGVGVGLWTSVEAAAESMVEKDKVFAAESKNRNVYAKLLESYKLLMDTCKPIFPKL